LTCGPYNAGGFGEPLDLIPAENRLCVPRSTALAEQSVTGGRMIKFLKDVWAAWKRVGRFIGDIIARVVLSVFYFTLFVPFAVGVRLFGDPLDVKEKTKSPRWLTFTPRDPALDDARRQF
jgi:hypothetical protein